MLDRNITSADAIVVMNGVFSTTFTNFSADGAWDIEPYEFLEHRMGVDGHVAIGFTPVEKAITFHFEANSPALAVLNAMYQAMELNKTAYDENIVITLKSTGKTYNLNHCYLTSYRILPDGARTLEPVDAVFTFESITEQTI